MTYLPLMESHRAPVSASVLSDFVAQSGRGELPDDYLAFVRETDGGRFVADLVLLPGDAAGDTVLNGVYGIDPDEDDNVLSVYRDYRAMARIPAATLPIADDPGGNTLLLSLEPATNGAVFFWDHEREAGGGTVLADFPNVRLVAASFAALIGALGRI